MKSNIANRRRQSAEVHREPDPAEKLSAAVAESNVRSQQYDDAPSLPKDVLEKHARAIAAQINLLHRTTIERALHIGQHLKQVQELLANHNGGTFQSWLKERLGMGQATAYRYIAAFDFLGDPGCTKLIRRFDLSAIYLLASDKCPEAAGAEAMKTASKGTKITSKVAHEIVEKHLPPQEESRFDLNDASLSLHDTLQRLVKKWPDEFRSVFCALLAQQSKELKPAGVAKSPP